jgi:hypothetical protein
MWGRRETMSEPEVVLVSRYDSVDDLVRQCARGELKFSGPDSLCAKISAMGFNTTSLYEMVMCAKADTNQEPPR